MSNQHAPIRQSIVELAMARASRHDAGSDTPSPSPQPLERSLGRRAYDETLPHHTSPGQFAPSEAISPSPEASPKAEAGLTHASDIKLGHIRRMASHLISAATGAAVMWGAMGDPAAPAKPVAPAITATVATAGPSISVPPPIALPDGVPVDAQVRDMLDRWRQSWSDRDTDSYLGFYSAHFVPADGTRRSAWAEGRRKNFLSRPAISVGIHDLQIRPIGRQQVKVVLLQDYASGSYKETRQPKTFLLNQEGTEWRIVGEWQGDHSVTQ